MSMQRITWGELPPSVVAAVTVFTGPIHDVTGASDGANSAIAAVLDTQGGRQFVKGIPVGHSQAVTQHREAQINPALPPSSPRLLWRVQKDGWDLLGFEYLHGRAADYRPGSPDLPKVVAALVELAATPAPDRMELKTVAGRWRQHVPASSLPLLQGDAFLHTDLAPHNVLISDRAHLIDWAWPTLGPAWVDPAVWIVRLIDAGHAPDSAEAWARQLPAWRKAPAAAVDVFAMANAALWHDLAHQDPGTEWKKHMAYSARAWAAHRLADL